MVALVATYVFLLGAGFLSLRPVQKFSGGDSVEFCGLIPYLVSPFFPFCPYFIFLLPKKFGSSGESIPLWLPLLLAVPLGSLEKSLLVEKTPRVFLSFPPFSRFLQFSIVEGFSGNASFFV